MKKYEMVKSHEDFNKIIQQGKKVSNKYFNIFSLPNNNKPNHYGIAVGKKIGNAVQRNKWKRRIRMLLDRYKLLFEKSNNYIIMIKKECLDISFMDLEKSFLNLIRKEQNEQKK